VTEALSAYSDYLKAVERGEDVDKPKIKMPEFLTFIRQPFCVSFRVNGFPGIVPYEFFAVNAHLYYGKYIADRRQEFDALMKWIIASVASDDTNYCADIMLLGDLNLDYDNPERDRERMLEVLKPVQTDLGRTCNINFPFLDAHRQHGAVFNTNARMNQTFDQIGLFFRDQRWPSEDQNELMPLPSGESYGVFNFAELFAMALRGRTLTELFADPDFDKRDFYSFFEYNVSDHMPLWFRMPLPAESSTP